MNEMYFYFPLLFLLHFVADFLFQSRSMAINKSKNFKVLFMHCCVHFLAFWLGMQPFIGPSVAYISAIVNALVHGMIDWNIWRSYKRYLKRNNKTEQFKWWEDHWFYVTIGFDQLLHAISICMIYTYALKFV